MLLAKTNPRHRAWVEINPDAIEENTKFIKSILSKNCSLMAVVKADGYGHGATTVSKAVLKGGAENLGVATLQEGIDLRRDGIECPILVLGNLINHDDLTACIDSDLIPTLSTYEQAALCQKIGKEINKQVKIHLKIDTGMTRLGCEVEAAEELIKYIDSQSNLSLAGIYSHLALADCSLNERSAKVTAEQKKKFDRVLKLITNRRNGVCKHLANSAGTLKDSELHYDMVRVGLALYGYSPIMQFQKNFALRSALAVKARVTLIRDVPVGTGVSYGHNYITSAPSRLAVVAIGYADGVPRALSGQLSVLINGKFFSQVGSITMDQLVIDITNSFDVEVGSIVTLLGSDGEKTITPYDWSEASRSIPWEILCGFKYRLPRVVI